MKIIEYEIDYEHFNVHYEYEKLAVEFKVYPIQHWEAVDGSEEGIDYLNCKHEGSVEDYRDENVLIKLKGFCSWRGTWDNRLYFTDDEYYSEELEILSKLYKKIEAHCKEYLKAKYSHIDED